MPISKAEATWKGALSGGEGHLKFGSGAWEGPYSYVSRFEGSGDTTTPEELIGAADAGCFSMALTNMLDEAGHTPDELHTEAEVELDVEALEVTSIHLTVEGDVPGVDEETFAEHAEEAKANCPISKALAGTEITVEASLR